MANINEYQLQVLEYEIERYPDVVSIVLKKMRMRIVPQISQKTFPRFMKAMNKVKFERYVTKR